MGMVPNNSELGSLVDVFFKDVIGVKSSTTIPCNLENKDTFSHLIRGLLKLTHIHPGHISCFLSVKPPVTVISLSLCISCMFVVPRKLGFL